ncbi:MAG: hypothetical protein QNJ47_03340 [Nostocaceae cyanobacterium]|nr:hypothetical protein [Nostocaceae cyanobacterium]
MNQKLGFFPINPDSRYPVEGSPRPGSISNRNPLLVQVLLVDPDAFPCDRKFLI